MEYPLKYDINICVHRIKFTSQESKNKFKTDFDETYNVFLVKLEGLMTQYGVAGIDTDLSEYLLKKHPTF